MQFTWLMLYISISPFDSVPLLLCQAYYTFVVVVWEMHLLSLLFSLRDRIITTYDDQPKTIAFLTWLLTLEGLVSTLWSLSVEFRGEIRGPCLVWKLPQDFMYYSLFHLMCQAVFWIFACRSFERARKLFREISPAFSTVFILFLSLLISVDLINIPGNGPWLNPQFFLSQPPVFILIVSVSGCRLIINTDLTKASEAMEQGP